MRHEGESSLASVAPLGVHRVVPARIIGLIGLEEGVFPRKRQGESTRSLTGQSR